ncbi:hypothetical protein [Kineococcus esterisolvens]|uniref:hypothetical protein n=1 Tax=unclassified Kineococcus TaxID=2621656 RepID=UPI003D7C7C29
MVDEVADGVAGAASGADAGVGVVSGGGEVRWVLDELVGSAADLARRWDAQRALAQARDVTDDADGYLPDDLLVLRELLERLPAAVAGELRAQGASWAEVGAVLRTSKQAAHERYGRDAR